MHYLSNPTGGSFDAGDSWYLPIPFISLLSPFIRKKCNFKFKNSETVSWYMLKFVLDEDLIFFEFHEQFCLQCFQLLPSLSSRFASTVCLCCILACACDCVFVLHRNWLTHDNSKIAVGSRFHNPSRGCGQWQVCVLIFTVVAQGSASKYKSITSWLWSIKSILNSTVSETCFVNWNCHCLVRCQLARCLARKWIDWLEIQDSYYYNLKPMAIRIPNN